MSDLRHDLKFNAVISVKPGKTPLGTPYTVYGDSTEILIFIHGVGMNQHVWQSQVDYFSNHYQVIVYDLLGHGDSPRPSEQVCLDEYCHQLLELLDWLKLDCVSLIGHSTGALISVEFALDHPDRVNTLIPMNIVYRRNAAQRTAVLDRANQVLKHNKIQGIENTLERWFSSKTDSCNQEKIDRIRQYLENVDPVGYGRTYLMFAQSDQAFDGRLPQLNRPVLYLTGDADPNSTNKMSEQMAKESPCGQARSVSGEAHMMAYISPDKINPIIEEFLISQRVV